MKLCKSNIKRILRSRPIQLIVILGGILTVAFYLRIHHKKVLADFTKESDDLVQIPFGRNIETVVLKPLPYNATKEIIARRAQAVKSCRRPWSRPNIFYRKFNGTNYRTQMVSRWGVSTGEVPFFTCFLPKAASTSMGAAMLMATGWLDKSQGKEITRDVYGKGRNKCMGKGSYQLLKHYPTALITSV